MFQVNIICEGSGNVISSLSYDGDEAPGFTTINNGYRMEIIHPNGDVEELAWEED